MNIKKIWHLRRDAAVWSAEFCWMANPFKSQTFLPIRNTGFVRSQGLVQHPARAVSGARQGARINRILGRKLMTHRITRRHVNTGIGAALISPALARTSAFAQSGG